VSGPPLITVGLVIISSSWLLSWQHLGLLLWNPSMVLFVFKTVLLALLQWIKWSVYVLPYTHMRCILRFNSFHDLNPSITLVKKVASSEAMSWSFSQTLNWSAVRNCIIYTYTWLQTKGCKN
jgi:hypothetical protein